MESVGESGECHRHATRALWEHNEEYNSVRGYRRNIMRALEYYDGVSKHTRTSVEYDRKLRLNVILVNHYTTTNFTLDHGP